MSKAPSPRYRLGLDLGANSLGYFLVKLDKRGEACGIVRGGVRIYPDGRDPQSGTSNAVDRRQARGARRRRDRYLERRTALMALLVRCGLMPEQPAEEPKLAPIWCLKLVNGWLSITRPLSRWQNRRKQATPPPIYDCYFMPSMLG